MRFAAPFLGFFSLVTALAALPALPQRASLDALLGRSRAASGAPYRYHIVSRSHESADGRTFDVTTETQGLKYRARRCLHSVCTGFYFDGERSFDTNVNDTALPVSQDVDPLQITLRAIASYAFTATDFRSTGGRIEELDDAAREGRTYRRLAVTAPHGARLDALIDPATALVTAVVAPGDKLAFDFGDQRKVAGDVTLPFSIFLNGASTERFDERGVVRGTLEAPAGIVPHVAGGTTTVPMLEKARFGDQPVTACTLGGIAATCLLDTGNSGLGLGLELAEKLGLEPDAGALAIAGVGDYVTGLVDAPELTVGNATFPRAHYVVLHDVGQYGYDVVLGADAFAHARITLDYAKRTVVVADAATPGASQQHGVPLSFERFLPVATVGLGGTTVPLGIDSGDQNAIDVRSDYYAEHPTLFAAAGKGAVAGVGGASDQVTGTMAHVRFGEFDVAPSAIAATNHLPGAGRGHVGSALLAHFVATFDYGRARLELAPVPGDTAVRPAPTSSAASL